jgi:hypothetical protein
MSLLSIATIFQFSSLASSAKCLEPYSPCSSYRHKMDGVGKDLLLIILVSSIIAATPEPSSLAPGASDLLSITSVTLESRCPLMISTRSVASVPLTLPLHCPADCQLQCVFHLFYSEIINL